MNQKECINVKFSEGLGIFDDNCGYPVIDEQEKYNGATGRVREYRRMQGVISSSLKKKVPVTIIKKLYRS